MPFNIRNQSRSCSVSTKVDWNFYNIVKTYLIMINNVNYLTIYVSLLQNIIKLLSTTYQNKTKDLGKVRKLLVWQNWLKFYDKMNLSIRMRIISKVKHLYAIRLKFGDFSNQVSAQCENQYQLYDQRKSTFLLS